MTENGCAGVTGAFSYTGRFLTQRLIESGREVVTLTGRSFNDCPFGDAVRVHPYDFQNPEQLTEALKGVDTFYNTYWVRFSYNDITFDTAVENSRILIQACRDAGVKRFIHISIANASDAPHLPYYAGKALVEDSLRESGLSYAIIRPTVLFGEEGILINNIAWFLRHFPIFCVPGDGQYRIQPVYVEDLARMMLAAGDRDDNIEMDAVGPEIYTFNELLRLLDKKMRSKTLLVHVSPVAALRWCGMMNPMLRDLILTREEIDGLMNNLLISHNPPTADTRLSNWLDENAYWLGNCYFSEIRRHYRRNNVHAAQ